ncbi:transmembrane and coiled-coil domain-containing protein 4-like [Dermatophagoides pteronyssinus]|uniref:Transmembrane and coiled-coil domain-containing protein 4-like n=2 Tax=Dermatophagoides pteronyssinus TaxID=6956 RepID=A0A6P6XWQ8_DERPT|nr:transmembrane and coiled-coil domain-containing protein 4-like [Dermatophagoides pteronyssinus]KAH9420136.1 Transmembrane coiled-coil domain-containing protein 4 [Dermatophagoides pteronyssinus]
MNNQNLDDEMMKVIGDENGNEDHHQYNRSSQLIGTSLISTTASIPLLGSSTSDSMISTRMTRYKSTLIDCLGDAGSYSLCGLCTLLFHKYFPESHHRPFIEKSIKDLVAYLNLPAKVSASMIAMIDGEGGADLNSFIKLIYKEMDKKAMKSTQIVEDLVVFAVKDGNYDARMRVILIKLANFLGSSLEYLELSELSLVEMLSTAEVKNNDDDDQRQRRRNQTKKIKRYALIALASIGGGAILGLTGGLSAPLIAAGATALTSGAAILGTPAGVAVIGSLFGVAGAGLAGYKMNKRVGNIEEFAFENLSDNRSLTLTIAISGWITEESDDAYSKHWKSLANSQEQYSLRYESSYLLELGKALNYFIGFAISMAAQEALKYTLLSGIMAAIAWPTTLLTISSVIDNPWGVCISRSAEVGKFLADVLLSRQQGQRPVSLIGFSLGARVIFFCLEELAQRQNSEGIIEDVVLLGAPVSAVPERWERFMSIISGKIINGFCRDDWLLKFLYRTSTATMRIAGLQEVNLKNKKLENHDLTDMIKGHMDYCHKIDAVLDKIGIRIYKNDDENDSNMDVDTATDLESTENDNQSNAD